MKTKNLLILLAIAGIMIFASCKKDETPEPLTKDEATTALTTISTNYGTDMEGFENSDATEAKDVVDDLGLPFFSGGLKAPINAKTLDKEILKVYNPSNVSKGEGPYIDVYMTTNAGTWQKVDGEWTRTLTTPTDKIVVIFSYNGGNNNATLTFFNYEKKTVTYGEETMSYMSSLSCKLDIIGMTNPVISWDYTASLKYSTTSSVMKMKFVYKLGEYALTQSFGVSGSSSLSSSKIEISAFEEIKKSGEVLRSTLIEMTMTASQSSQSYSFIAKFRIKNIIIKWDINLDQNTNTEGNPDDYMDISVWTADGAKVADVIFKLEGEEYIAYFKFTDGTEQKISELLSEYLYLEILDFNEEIMDFKK